MRSTLSDLARARHYGLLGPLLPGYVDVVVDGTTESLLEAAGALAKDGWITDERSERISAAVSSTTPTSAPSVSSSPGPDIDFRL